MTTHAPHSENQQPSVSSAGLTVPGLLEENEKLRSSLQASVASERLLRKYLKLSVEFCTIQKREYENMIHSVSRAGKPSSPLISGVDISSTHEMARRLGIEEGLCESFWNASAFEFGSNVLATRLSEESAAAAAKLQRWTESVQEHAQHKINDAIASTETLVSAQFNRIQSTITYVEQRQSALHKRCIQSVKDLKKQNRLSLHGLQVAQQKILQLDRTVKEQRTALEAERRASQEARQALAQMRERAFSIARHPRWEDLYHNTKTMMSLLQSTVYPSAEAGFLTTIREAIERAEGHAQLLLMTSHNGTSPVSSTPTPAALLSRGHFPPSGVESIGEEDHADCLHASLTLSETNEVNAATQAFERDTIIAEHWQASLQSYIQMLKNIHALLENDFMERRTVLERLTQVFHGFEAFLEKRRDDFDDIHSGKQLVAV